MNEIIESRRIERLEKKRHHSKNRYEKNKSEILQKRAENYEENKSAILSKRADHYKSNKKLCYQRLRFRKHFGEKEANNYLTSQQELLYHHCLGVCQLDTLKSFNHSVEFYDGLCSFCKKAQGVKLIGVNRQVCMNCKRGQCCICYREVNPNPEFGCFHFSPDTGHLLNFFPKYCPLYSIGSFPRYSAVNSHKHKIDCKICLLVKAEYPEYEIFCEKKIQTRVMEDGYRYDKVELSIYSCNLCGSAFDFACEFDQHMRCHTRYGKNIAIIGLKSPQPLDRWENDRVDEEIFSIIEDQLFKVSEISAVLVVFRLLHHHIIAF